MKVVVTQAAHIALNSLREANLKKVRAKIDLLEVTQKLDASGLRVNRLAGLIPTLYSLRATSDIRVLFEVPKKNKIRIIEIVKEDRIRKMFPSQARDAKRRKR